MKNTKGLSTIVTTLIIILLVLVAVGIIWGVVSNLLNKSTGTIESNTKCLDIEITATKIVDNTDNTYNITLSRSSVGSDDGFGAKVVFFSDTENSEVLTFEPDAGATELTPLRILTDTLDAGFTGANKVQVTPYFLDQNGVQQLCSSRTQEF